MNGFEKLPAKAATPNFFFSSYGPRSSQIFDCFLNLFDFPRKLDILGSVEITGQEKLPCISSHTQKVLAKKNIARGKVKFLIL